MTLLKDTDDERIAYQNGAAVYRWSRQEVDRMHAESPQTCAAFGAYSGSRPRLPFDVRAAERGEK